MSSLALQLCSVGIGAIRFDALGSGESDGTFEADYRLTTYVNNFSDVLNFVKASAQPTSSNSIDDTPTQQNFLRAIDTSRIGVWGHSMGGYVALEGAARHQAEVRCAVGSQPSMGRSVSISNNEIEEWCASDMMTFSNENFVEINLPFEFCLDRMKHDSVSTVSRLHLPLLLIAGNKDEDVPANVVREIYDAANQPKTYKEFDTDHHYKNDPAQLQLINDQTAEFFQTHLSDQNSQRIELPDSDLRRSGSINCITYY